MRASGRFSSRSTQSYFARARVLVTRHCPGAGPATPNTTLRGDCSGRTRAPHPVPKGLVVGKLGVGARGKVEVLFAFPAVPATGGRRGGPVVTRHPAVAADRACVCGCGCGRSADGGRAAGGGRRTAGGGRGRQFFLACLRSSLERCGMAKINAPPKDSSRARRLLSSGASQRDRRSQAAPRNCHPPLAAHCSPPRSHSSSSC